MVLHLPHAECGFGVTFNDFIKDTVFHTTTSRFVVWIGTFSRDIRSCGCPRMIFGTRPHGHHPRGDGENIIHKQGGGVQHNKERGKFFFSLKRRCGKKKNGCTDETMVGGALPRASVLRVDLGVNGVTNVSGSCAHPSDSWISSLLTSSLSLGIELN
jgi:hypothetical protein